ncbi:hypothetical protein [Sphingomonas kyeonggiensis]|uniref:YD repeat-containing protein n=1 Tax=Sphingomonas kyeonggiensis TaxID=1268553 RepID=A0A7W6JQ20_9SPHN|nr:hypothetical protein [Sphingomonas kyeonggiensis]MBB4097482.1 YD repeat-containing protein [Sphingomonas kyeonggiensis]
MRSILIGGVALSVGFASNASANETVTYTYDARGRLVKVERSGTVNNGVKTEYTLDKANNRKNVKVSGSPNPAP